MTRSYAAVRSIYLANPDVDLPTLKKGHLYAAMGNVKSAGELAWKVTSNTVKDGEREVYQVRAEPDGEFLRWTCTCKASEFGKSVGFDLQGEKGEGQVCKHICAAAITFVVPSLLDQPPINMFSTLQVLINEQAIYLNAGELAEFYAGVKLVREAHNLHLKRGRQTSAPIGQLLNGKWQLHENASDHYATWVEQINASN